MYCNKGYKKYYYQCWRTFILDGLKRWPTTCVAAVDRNGSAIVCYETDPFILIVW